jgi:hypothetical protein
MQLHFLDWDAECCTHHANPEKYSGEMGITVLFQHFGVRDSIYATSILSGIWGVTRGSTNHHETLRHVDTLCTLSHTVERGTDVCTEFQRMNQNSMTHSLTETLNIAKRPHAISVKAINMRSAQESCDIHLQHAFPGTTPLPCLTWSPESAQSTLF